MKYVKKRKTKCNLCKKLKTVARFPETDFGWNVFRQSHTCLVCSRKRDKQWDRNKKKWMRKQEKTRKAIEEGRLLLVSPGIWIKPKRDQRFEYPTVLGQEVEIR